MTVDKIFIAISKNHILKSTKSHSHINKITFSYQQSSYL